jgi:hypothetical protein
LGRRTFFRVAETSRHAAAVLLTISVVSPRPARAAEPASDPMTTCIAENERSLDLRRAGSLLDARRELAACSAAPCPDAIQQACRGRIAELNAAIPSIVFEVKEATGQDLTDAKIGVDGQPAETAGFTARAVDPGRHVFHFEAPGHRPLEKAIVLREGEKDRREAVVLERSEEASAAASAPSGSLIGPAPAPSRPGGGLQTAGWIAGGAGVVTMAVGGSLGLIARSSYENAQGCAGTVCASQTGLDARNSARTTGDVATVVFVAGAAATAVGVVLWVVGRSSTNVAGVPAWRAGLTPGGVVAGGTF